METEQLGSSKKTSLGRCNVEHSVQLFNPTTLHCID